MEEDKIYFSERQVVRRVRHIDRATGKTEYVPMYHSTRKNKDGSPKRYCRIRVLDKDHRDFSFPPDDFGVERNGCSCYIQAPYDSVFNIKRDGKKTLQSFLIVTNPSEYTRFTVYFQGMRDETGKFITPKPIKIGLDDLKKCFVRREKDLVQDQQKEKVEKAPEKKSAERAR